MSGRVTLHVLDPIARQLLIERNWWRDTFESAEELTSHFPEQSYWVDCAQAIAADGANTLTILNTWALAIGLELDPSFGLNKVTDDFTAEAQ
jgi:hypothetical protein